MANSYLRPAEPKPKVSSLFEEYANNPEWEVVLPPTFVEVVQDSLEVSPVISSTEIALDEMVPLFTKSLQDILSPKTVSQIGILKVGVLVSPFRPDNTRTTDPKDAYIEPVNSIREMLDIPQLAWGQLGIEYLRFAPWQKSKFVRDDQELERYIFRAQYNHLSIVWIAFPTMKTTIGLIYTSNYYTNYDVKRIVDTLQAGNLPYQHPLLLALIANQILTTSASWSLGRYSWAISKCQIQTGYHRWQAMERSNLDFEQIDVSGITRDTVTASAMLTSTEALMKSYTTWARHLSEDNEWLAGTGYYDSKCIEFARVMAQGCERRSEFLSEQCIAAHQNATSIMQGLFNLIAQRDQNINISLARDSRKLAASSKRDSTSMKAIAAVTMFFLPGTFTASLFATPFFGAISGTFDSINSFWVYWIVTVPLTIITISAWFWWIRRVDRIQLQEMEDLEGSNTTRMNHGEAKMESKEEKMKTG